MTNPYRALCEELLTDYEQNRFRVELAAEARTLLAQPDPEGPEGSYFTDGDYNREIHYAWELHDAEGEWQAGGSAITLESVRREGNHYLQTYSQDGPHTLIIYQASTIEVVTND